MRILTCGTNVIATVPDYALQSESHKACARGVASNRPYPAGCSCGGLHLGDAGDPPEEPSPPKRTAVKISHQARNTHSLEFGLLPAVVSAYALLMGTEALHPMASKPQRSKAPAAALHKSRDRNTWPEQSYRYVEHYFWEPQHLIKTEKAARAAHRRGERNIEAFYRLIRSQEVPLNFCLNLVLRIAPPGVRIAFLRQFHVDRAPSDILEPQLLYGEDHPFTQPDLLLQTSTQRFFVELKVSGSASITPAPNRPVMDASPTSSCCAVNVRAPLPGIDSRTAPPVAAAPVSSRALILTALDISPGFLPVPALRRFSLTPATARNRRQPRRCWWARASRRCCRSSPC